MNDDEADDLLRDMASDVKVAAHLRLGALKELGRRHVPEPQPVPPGAGEPLTAEERKLVADAMYWDFDPSLWDDEQRALCLRVGLITQKELDAADDAVIKSRRRNGDTSVDELASRRRRRRGIT